MAQVKLGSKALCSLVKLNENGKPVDFYVATHDYESGLNGPGRTLLVRKDVYDQRRWDSSCNAYASSEIDSWFNGSYKNMLDSDIRAAMGATKFYYTIGNGNSTMAVLERHVFALSATELGQSAAYFNKEGTELPSAVLNVLKVAHLNGAAVSQYTRSATATNSNIFLVVRLGPNGAVDSINSQCSNAHGSRPAFTLPSSLMVSDDGTVNANTAPSTPASISIPSSIQGGSTITVSWGASTDAESNLEGYVVERSTNGGGSWTQVYQGTGTSTTNTVPAGSETVMYRVKAYDSEGLYSSYRNSAQVSVFNNAAPGAPASVTVPENVLGGGTLTVTWDAASDPDNNLTGYELERQVDGGEWTQIYKGADTSYTDDITRGWTSVNYRVRSYDVYDAASGYTTGTARTVNNNRAPAIDCGAASGSDLGTKSAGFSMDYSVSDEDGDAVSVAEAIDGVERRTFSATLGGGNTFAVTGDTFFTLLNGEHVLTISASDGKAATVHKLTFTKKVNTATVTLAEPMEADDKINICVLSVQGHIPDDAEYTVEVTNNALDDEPVWENCTMETRNRGNHIFTNETAVNGFAFSFRVSAKRGPSDEGGHIDSVQGGFQ